MWSCPPPPPAPRCLKREQPPFLAPGHPGQLGNPTPSTEAAPPPAVCPSLPPGSWEGLETRGLDPSPGGGRWTPESTAPTTPHVCQVLPTDPPSPSAPDLTEPKEEQPPVPSQPTEEEDEEEEETEEEEEGEEGEEEDSQVQGEQPKVCVQGRKE